MLSVFVCCVCCVCLLCLFGITSQVDLAASVYLCDALTTCYLPSLNTLIPSHRLKVPALDEKKVFLLGYSMGANTDL